jgi:outer membrane protein assembly factor BamD (BamD/ComL family)
MKQSFFKFCILIIIIPAIIQPISCSSSKQTQQVSSAEYLELAEKIDEIDTVEAEKLIGLIGFYYGRHRFDEALEVVQKVIANYPGSVYSDNAYYLKGLIYSDTLNYDRDMGKAAAAYRMVLDSLPETEFDKKAREELEKIKLNRP